MEVGVNEAVKTTARVCEMVVFYKIFVPNIQLAQNGFRIAREPLGNVVVKPRMRGAHLDTAPEIKRESNHIVRKGKLRIMDLATLAMGGIRARQRDRTAVVQFPVHKLVKAVLGGNTSVSNRPQWSTRKSLT